MTRIFKCTFSLVVFVIGSITIYAGEPFLSNLEVQADDPLYTTYAAQKERSEFTLDQGYHLQFYTPDEGIKLTTDRAGDWLTGFQLGNKFVYKIEDMAKPPEISLSYTDMVQYTYFPFENIRVDASFLVQSSHFAIHDLKISNNRNEQIELGVYSVLENNYRAFEHVETIASGDGITFYHQELPDSWVLSHSVPYVDNVQNIYLLSEKPTHISTYHSFDNKNISLPRQVNLSAPAKYSVSGNILHSDGSRCRHPFPKSDIIVHLNNDRNLILNHSAPKFGTSRPNISGYGSYSVDLGNFPELKSGSEFTIRFTCLATDESVTVTDTVTQSIETKEHDLNLRLEPKDEDIALLNLDKRFNNNGNSLMLKWDTSKGFNDQVYRRKYKQHGYFEQIKTVRNGTFSDDFGKDDLFEYFIISVNKNGDIKNYSDIMNSSGFYNFMDSLNKSRNEQRAVDGITKVISLQNTFKIESGETKDVRAIRGVARPDEPSEKLYQRVKEFLKLDFNPFVLANEKLYSSIPEIEFKNTEEKLLYWSAFTLMRQVMLPPEAKAGYNYYVFSREPTWGWGHGGQVFHESLTMLAYALMDPISAMNSQRVYRERQFENGYISYRSGSYLDETIPVNGQPTTSAPWYAWLNWEIYELTGDQEFLREMYESSKAFYNYYVSNRDSDGDGLCEWGAHAVLESVRDARVAVWDEVAWPTHFEAMDLNSMLVSEERALAHMAEKLGLHTEMLEWDAKADRRTQLINNTMWDEDTGFYYQIDKVDHDFTFENPDDLKRQELIGFLPLWAGIADKNQAEKLVGHMTNPDKFWRKYGIPSLAADDPYYDPEGYWNGPVWVEWQYLFLRGLLDYGYHDVAAELVDKVAANMISQLKEDHIFWEFYSPDNEWGGHHQTYIWAGLIAKMLHEVRIK